MEKEFVPYELALRLKQLGFDESCFGWYADETHLSIRPQYIQPNDPNNVYNWCLAPTFSQAFRWFRDKYNIFHNVDKLFAYEFGYIIYENDKEPMNCFNFNSYKESELDCLKKIIEIVE
jgi:hypothetical protein